MTLSAYLEVHSHSGGRKYGDVLGEVDLLFTFSSSADEEVQPTCSPDQGPLHGLQGPGGHPGSLSLCPQPSFHCKSESSRKVSSNFST